MTVKEALDRVYLKKLTIRTHSIVEKSLLICAGYMHGYNMNFCAPELWECYPVLYKGSLKHGRSLSFVADDWHFLRDIPAIDFADLTGISTETTAAIEEKLICRTCPIHRYRSTFVNLKKGSSSCQLN